MEWKRFGYGLILVIVSMIRELFGSGELMGYRIIPESIYKLGYFNNSLVYHASYGANQGILIWIQRSRNQN
jgi:Na+-transporting NADH:ubiquinone oxidoreductase subunit D